MFRLFSEFLVRGVLFLCLYSVKSAKSLVPSTLFSIFRCARFVASRSARRLQPGSTMSLCSPVENFLIFCVCTSILYVVVVELLLLATTLLWPRRQSLSSLLSSSLDDNIADKSKPPLLPVSSMLSALFRNDISTPPCAPPLVVSTDANTTVEL